MKKLIAFVIALFIVTAVQAGVDNLTVTPVFYPASYTGNTTNSSTNYSSGFKYLGTNSTPINAAIPSFGNSLFVFRSANASATNTQSILLQDSSDNTNYTTRSTLYITSTNPVTYYTNLNVMALYWRVQLVTTNAAITSNTSGDLIWDNRIK